MYGFDQRAIQELMKDIFDYSKKTFWFNYTPCTHEYGGKEYCMKCRYASICMLEEKINKALK